MHKFVLRKLTGVPEERIVFHIQFSGGGTPLLSHNRDVWPKWVSFPGQKPADGCKFLTKNLQMGHNFDT